MGFEPGRGGVVPGGFPRSEGVGCVEVAEGGGGGEASAGKALRGTVAPTMVQVVNAFDVQVGQRLRDELHLGTVDGFLFPRVFETNIEHHSEPNVSCVF